MRCALLLVLFAVFTSSVVTWPSSKAKDADSETCPYMQQKYPHDDSGPAACPLKDRCPLYAVVVRGEGDISLDSLKSADINWSQASQSNAFQKLIVECPLAHLCPYLRDTAADAHDFDKIPKDHIEKLLQKCPRLANSPQARHHVAAAMLGENTTGGIGKCPYIARPDDDASINAWEEFYKQSAECPWIQEHGIDGLAKSPKAYETALQVNLQIGC
jgi:hypothetical protein